MRKRVTSGSSRIIVGGGKGKACAVAPLRRSANQRVRNAANGIHIAIPGGAISREIIMSEAKTNLISPEELRKELKAIGRIVK